MVVEPPQQDLLRGQLVKVLLHLALLHEVNQVRAALSPYQEQDKKRGEKGQKKKRKKKKRKKNKRAADFGTAYIYSSTAVYQGKYKYTPDTMHSIHRE